MGQYIYYKQRILKQFGVFMTDHQLAHMKSLSTEIAVDNFARSLIIHKLNT